MKNARFGTGRLCRILCGTLVGCVALATRARADDNPISSFMGHVQKSLQDAVQGKTGSTQNTGAHNTVIDTVGLRSILPQYDPDQSAGTQFPHVAFTILKSPPKWTSVPVAFTGCWTLSATVWSDEKTSKAVGPFDWCMPKDQQIALGPQAGWGLPTPRVIDLAYVTGIHRTTGPRPPSSVIPDDARTKSLELEQGHAAYDMDGLYTATAFGTMFANLRHQLGADVTTDNGDVRVWVVQIQ